MAQSAQPNPTEARIAAIDAKEPSPSDRATAIYSILKKHAPELTSWDLICFSAEYLAKTAVEYVWLMEYVKPIARVIYLAHYYDNEHTRTESGIGTQLEHTDSGDSRSKKDGPRTLFKSDGP